MTSGVFNWTAGVQRAVLPNGLTVLAQYDRDAPAVGVVTHVRAGFFDEPDRWQGISHVLEHMFFKGTPTRGPGQIATETKALGGYLNASTSYDSTSYYVVLPAAGFDRALAIQADALRHALVDADELARELRVIIEEAKRKLDSASAVTYETLHAVLFDRHRIRRWRIGVEEQLAGFGREDVAGYYRSRYVPERVIVAVVGPVPVDEVFRQVEARYGDWSAAPGAVDRSPEEPWRREVRARTLRGDVTQAELAVGWRGLPALHPKAASLDLAAIVLGSGRGSWLYRALRQTGLVTSIGAYHYSPSEVGVFSVAADLDPARLAPALDGVAAGVAALRIEGPSEIHLTRARTLLTAQWARRFESVEGRASAFAAAEAYGGLDVLEQEFAAILAATPASVRQAAEAYLGPDRAGAVAYLPEGRGTDLTAEMLAAALERNAPATRPNGGPPPIPATRPRRSGRGRVTADVEHLALPGADLLVRRKTGVPLVSLGVYRLRQLVEPKAEAGLGALAVRASARGAGDLDAGRLADAFEALGGSLSGSVAADWFGFSTSVLRDGLLPAATLLRTVLSSPRFEGAEVERERATLADEVAQSSDDMFRHPIELGLAAAFGDHRYGMPVKGWPESVRGLSTEQVRAWHGGELARGRTTVVAVGDLDRGEALDLLAGVFEGLAAPAVAGEPTVPAGLAAGERVEHRAKSQSALAMVFPGPGRVDPDRHAAQVLSAIASGLGGRLFQALRDRRSLAYTVLMSSWQRRGTGALVTYIATSPDREEEARAAMLSELARFREELVEPHELEDAVNYLAGQTEVQRQTAGAIGAEILDAWLIGTGLDELRDPTAGFRVVTRDRVRAVAEASLVADRRAEGVVRGRIG